MATIGDTEVTLDNPLTLNYCTPYLTLANALTHSTEDALCLQIALPSSESGFAMGAQL